MAWMGSEKPLASCGKEAASAIADGMERCVGGMEHCIRAGMDGMQHCVKEVMDGLRAIAFMFTLVAVVWLLAPCMFLHYGGHPSHDSL